MTLLYGHFSHQKRNRFDMGENGLIWFLFFFVLVSKKKKA